MDELSANPEEGFLKGNEAEILAEAMVGLEDTFELLMNEAVGKTGSLIGTAYISFRNNVQPTIRTVQENGLALANDIQSGSAQIAKEDYEASEVYNGAWNEMPEVNF
ncbi:hypothetical protein GTW20_10325 [Nocardiopsis alba]|uniref:Uncharacterized protein n=1 Tax=Nocardiopsis alba TaxID=53437 RepID=A0A7K2IRP3_9ACTN|nr:MULTISPECIES: hypothetical protein [Nocardiopsis]MEC3895369.1 hypothetical protein [Nocardiopsis sp. LDBS1602]MYR32659.1 hypothetical protein [Nocardiopsis alba]